MQGIGIQDNEFSEDFGITSEEMEQVIQDFHVEDEENAIKQIEEKRYEAELKEKGYTNITKMVFAFNGKENVMKVV